MDILSEEAQVGGELPGTNTAAGVEGDEPDRIIGLQQFPVGHHTNFVTTVNNDARRSYSPNGDPTLFGLGEERTEQKADEIDALGGSQLIIFEENHCDGDRDDNTKQGQTEKVEYVEEADATPSNEGERNNKMGKSGEERDPHLKTKFELKELYREARDLTQEWEKDNPLSGPTVKVADGKTVEKFNDLGLKLNGPSHTWKVYTRNKGCKKQMKPNEKIDSHEGNK